MSLPLMPLPLGETFDATSVLVGAGIGFIAGAATAYAFRKELERMFQSARERASQARERLAMGTQQRYLEWLEGRASALNVLREGAKLPELYIEPQFITPPPRPAVSNKPIEPPPPTIPLSTVMKAAPRLVLTGPAGSGRTALLAHITLKLIEAIRTSQPAFGLPERYLPIYLPLSELTLEPEPPPPADPQAKPPPPPDPIKPLVDSLTERMPILIQTGAPGLLQNSIKNGQAILLLDGLDELEAEAKSRCMAWLKTLLEAHPTLRVIITSAPSGYAPLSELEFAAIPLAPWTAAQVAQLAERWTHAAKGGSEDAARLATILKPVPGTSPLPIDVTLAAFMWQKRGSVPPNRAAAYGQTVDMFLEPVPAACPLSLTLARAVLGRLALTLLKENRFTAQRAEIEKLVVELLAPPVQAASAPPPEVAPAPEAAPTSEPTPTPEAGPGQTPPPEEKPKEPPKPKGTSESVEALCKCGLLVEQGKDRFAFLHGRIQAYLAAWQITQEGSGALLTQHLEDAEWADVLEFCAGLVNVAPLVDLLLKRNDSPDGDLFHSRLWMAANWAASAGPEATWRGKVLAQLAAQITKPDQLPVLRERAVMALLSTQDKGLGYVFKQAMVSPDPHLRAQAVRGLGMLGREQDLPTFVAALKDRDESVREAAVQAMAAVGGQAGIEHLASVLLEADESLRKVAALKLAEFQTDGWRILKEATREDDMLVRRAAAFGLAATRQDWARELLTKLEREDPQWFVRSAATEALASMKAAEEYVLDCSPIVLDQQGWLVEWAALRGTPLGLGRSAEPVLMRALNEGDVPVRLAAIHTLAYIGGEPAIEPLRAQLAAPEIEIRDAAYQALQVLGHKLGIKIKR